MQINQVPIRYLKLQKNKINHVFNGDPMQTSAYVDLIYRLISKSGPANGIFRICGAESETDGWSIIDR